eukprot:m.239808 g.239808  ORF g.239808 m.239808 type:complete len:166 (+) comp14085_c0_seq1:165-662(+)
MTEAKKVMLKLKSADEKVFDVTKDVANMSMTVKNLIEDLGYEDGSDEPIPLPSVNAAALEHVIKYCNHHVDDPPSRWPDYVDKSEPWGFDADFLKPFKEDLPGLFDVIAAANFMDIKNLLELCCKQVAGIIKGKSVEELRETFGLKNDFSEEEWAQVQRENAWCD